MSEHTKKLIGDANRTHGMTGTPLYKRWVGILTRCYNKKEKTYRYYGARGVKMCERWRTSFELFAQDVGPIPEGKSLDRFPNRNGDYEPGNVRWADSDEQGRNKRNNVLLEFNGVRKTIGQWSKETGIGYGALWNRIRRGHSVAEALDPQHRRTTYRIAKRRLRPEWIRSK